MAATTELTNVSYQLEDDNDTATTLSTDSYSSSSGLAASEICIMVIYIIIIFLGLIGNALVIFAIYKRSRQNVTSLLLCSLALSDFLMVLIFMPFKVADYFIFSWLLGGFMCKLISYVALITPACSGCMLMVISLERYIVILYPLKARSFLTKTRAIFIVAAAWIISLLLGIPAIVYQKHIRHTYPGYDDWYQCRKQFPSQAHSRFYSLYSFIILYFIPLYVMGFSYTRVILALYSSAITSKGLQQQQQQQQRITTTDKQNNIYKPPHQRNDGGACPATADGNACAVNQSDDNDPFPSPEAQQSTQGRTADSVAVTSGNQPEKKSGRKEKKSQVTLNDRRQVIVMLMVVVLLYAVCWGPLMIIHIFLRFGVLNEQSNGVHYASMVCHILAFTNSTVNPIVYGFMSRNFRRTVISALKNCCGKGGGLSKRNAYNSTTCNSRYYSTTCNSVTQASYVKRDPNTVTGGHNIEMTQYSKVPSSDGT